MSSNQKIIRVLHVINCMDCGGAETFIMNLYRKIDRSKIQFDFLLHSSHTGYFDHEITQMGGKIYRVPHYKIYNNISYKNSIESFFEEHSEYKIVHGHLGSCSHIYLKIAKIYGCFTIAHCHSSVPYKMNIKHFIYKHFSKKTVKYADVVFSCNREGAIYRYGLDVVNNKNKYYSVYNAIDFEKYKHNSDFVNEVSREFSIKDDELLIGHVGSFSKVKNHKYIVDVFNEALKKNNKLKLILVGEGACKRSIQENIRQLNITDKVIFAGLRDDVYKLLQRFDCFIFPSLREGIPLSLLEAQAAGIPCLISDKISSEAIYSNSVSLLSLESGKKTWAEALLKLANHQAYSSFCTPIDKRYDIKNLCDWITRFYLSNYKVH